MNLEIFKKIYNYKKFMLYEVKDFREITNRFAYSYPKVVEREREKNNSHGFERFLDVVGSNLEELGIYLAHTLNMVLKNNDFSEMIYFVELVNEVYENKEGLNDAKDRLSFITGMDIVFPEWYKSRKMMSREDLDVIIGRIYFIVYGNEIPQGYFMSYYKFIRETGYKTYKYINSREGLGLSFNIQ